MRVLLARALQTSHFTAQPKSYALDHWLPQGSDSGLSRHANSAWRVYYLSPYPNIMLGNIVLDWAHLGQRTDPVGHDCHGGTIYAEVFPPGVTGRSWAQFTSARLSTVVVAQLAVRDAEWGYVLFGPKWNGLVQNEIRGRGGATVGSDRVTITCSILLERLRYGQSVRYSGRGGKWCDDTWRKLRVNEITLGGSDTPRQKLARRLRIFSLSRRMCADI